MLDGGDIVLRPAERVDLNLYVGRKKIYYDTRFTDTDFDRAPYTDTGMAYGWNIGFRMPEKTNFQICYSAFDSQTGAYARRRNSRRNPTRSSLDQTRGRPRGSAPRESSDCVRQASTHGAVYMLKSMSSPVLQIAGWAPSIA